MNIITSSRLPGLCPARGLRECRLMSTERLSPRPKCRSLMGVRIVGTGKYVPDIVVSNDHLHDRLGFDSDWIVKRTGILERRHALPAPGHQRPVLRSRPDAASTRPASPRTTSISSCSAPSRRTCPFPRRPAWCRTASSSSARPSRSKPPAPASCTRSSPARPMCRRGQRPGPRHRRRLQLVASSTPTTSRPIPSSATAPGPCFVDARPARPGHSRLQPGRGRPRRRPAAAGPRAAAACRRRRADLAEGLHFMHMDGRAVFRWAVAILCDTIQDVLTRRQPQTADVNLYIAASGQHPHHQRRHRRAAHPAQQGLQQPGAYGNTSAGSHSAGPGRSARRRPAQAGRPRRAQRLRRRPGLGHRRYSLVKAAKAANIATYPRRPFGSLGSVGSLGNVGSLHIGMT